MARRPIRTFLLTAGGISAVVLAAVSVPLVVSPSGSSASTGTTAPTTAAPTATTKPSPLAAPSTPEGEEARTSVESRWLDSTARTTRIPRRALQAYVAASLQLRREVPVCGLTWSTLAAIGAAESDHGRFRGNEITADGTTRSRIIGAPLDGRRYRNIPDTDDGVLDMDTEHDRAVGPMQILPSTWARFAEDANGDDVLDPHSIDDAALTAASYLCASGRDLRRGTNWDTAIRTYNDSDDYVKTVHDLAQRYA